MSCSASKVAYDFRSADVRAGGQGAPLAAIYHQALLRALGSQRRYRGAQSRRRRQRHLVGWRRHADRLRYRPGQCPAQRFHEGARPRRHGPRRRAGAHRQGGRGAARRTAEASVSRRAATQSRSTASISPLRWPRASIPPTGAATLTAFTAARRRQGRSTCCRSGRRSSIVCGGGRHNPADHGDAADARRVEAVPAEAVGWRGDAIEAECFAFLAVRVLRGLPISFPTTTGAPRRCRAGGSRALVKRLLQERARAALGKVLERAEGHVAGALVDLQRHRVEGVDLGAVAAALAALRPRLPRALRRPGPGRAASRPATAIACRASPRRCSRRCRRRRAPASSRTITASATRSAGPTSASLKLASPARDGLEFGRPTALR